MSRTRYTLAFDHHNMVAAPVGSANIQTIFKTEDGITICYGTGSVPTDASTYAPGCILINTNTGKVYVNVETTKTNAANFDIIGTVES